MGRDPFMRRSGPDYIKTDGTVIKPYAFVHPCIVPGCAADGSFGFGAKLRKGQPGRWYCHKHRSIGEAEFAESGKPGKL